MGLDVPVTPGYQAPFWVGGEEGLGSHSAQIQSLSVLGEPAQVTWALQASVLTPGRWESKVPQSCLTLCDPMGCTAYQAPLSIGFSRQEYWSGLPLLPPRDLPNPGTESESSVSPVLQVDSLLVNHPGSPLYTPNGLTNNEPDLACCRANSSCFYFLFL